MAKPIHTKKPAGKPTAPAKEMKPLIPEKYQDAVYIGVLIVLVFAFFGGAIVGGGFQASDNIASGSYANYLQQASKEGNFPLWIPYIFGGMPSYAALLVTGDRSWDIVPYVVFGITKFVGLILSSDVGRMASFYAIYAIGMYLLMRTKKHDRLVAFMTAFGAVFSTYVITWVMIGHNTKPVVFAMFPFILMFIEKLREKFSFLYAALLVLAVHIMVEGGHLQMIFYGICIFGIYIIFELISRLITKGEPLKVLRAAGLLVLAGAFAFLMSSDRYLSTFEYTPYSTRGSAPIEKTANQHQDASGGHDYKYATMWSFSPQEMMTFFVPGYFGNGVREYNGQMQNTYWGQKETEDSPPYMGIVVLGFALLGLVFYRRDLFVQFLFVTAVFALFLSFGKNLHITIFGVYIPGLFDHFFYLVPSFNKFRAPSMALAMMHFAVPILAGYGLAGIFKAKANKDNSSVKILNVAMISAAVFFFIGLIFLLFFKDSYLSAVASKFKTAVDNLPADFTSFMWSSAAGDWLLGGFFVIYAFVLSYLFIKQKAIILFIAEVPLFLASSLLLHEVSGGLAPGGLSGGLIILLEFTLAFLFIKQKIGKIIFIIGTILCIVLWLSGIFIILLVFASAFLFIWQKEKSIFFIGIMLLIVVDLWRIDYRRMEYAPDKEQSDVFKQYEPLYKPLQQLQDTSMFRIMDMVAQPPNMTAYYMLQNVNGYHAAKLRIYQDLMDVANIAGFEGSTSILYNPFLWNLMNVKYIIAPDRQQQNRPMIYPNPQALPRAFFVNRFEVAKQMEILKKLKHSGEKPDEAFNPLDVAYIEKPLSKPIEPPDSTVYVKFEKYQDEYIRIAANASGNNLLFMSEIYYPPGWKAYIDGQETPIYKTNFAFRSIVVPKGRHNIEIKFTSKSFEQGKTYSIIANVIVLLGLFVGIFFEVRKRKHEAKNEELD